MKVLVKGFTNNTGTYGSQCSCDCNCNCNNVADQAGSSFLDELHCAWRKGFVNHGCPRYTPRG
ncbi:hypothetical protein [Clostridium sp.]|uniref:hypothetical protein n=1 Tax=Clostridium sp. TaxID=1506 RepID=UPI0032165952